MKRLFILFIAIVALNQFYPELFAPVKNFAGKAKPAGITKATPHLPQNQWVSVPKTFSFTDVRKQIHSFSGKTNKPAVIAFWIDQCGYSQNAMLVLNAIRRQYPEDKLDVVGLFLNERRESEIIEAARQEGYSVTLAATQTPEQLSALNSDAVAAFDKARAKPGATQKDVDQALTQVYQQSAPLIVTLHPGLHIRGPGRDIYIIDNKGLIHTVSTVDDKGNKKSLEEIIPRVEGVLQKIL